MVSREDEEAAIWTLVKLQYSLPMEMKRSDMVAIERKARDLIRYPRKKRTLRIPITDSIAVVAKEEPYHPPKAEILDTESSKRRSTRHSEKSLIMVPPPLEQQQPKKANLKDNGRFEAGGSSSETKESTAVMAKEETSYPPPKAEILDTESSKRRRSTRNSEKSLLLVPPPLEQQQPKKANRKDNGRFEAGGSSSETKESTPEWLLRLIRSKNGENPKKILNKGLTASDVNLDKYRLSIPINQIIDKDFLSPEEENIINLQNNTIRKKGIDVTLVASDLREFELNLRLWNMGDSPPLFNLVTGWNQVVKTYRFKKNDQIRLWSFHANGKLYFALVPPEQT